MTAHTTMSKVSRIEVVSTGARRRWTLEEKRRIVAESYGGRGEVSATARRHGLSGGQLFTWRQFAREGRLGDEAAALVPVKLAVPATEGRSRLKAIAAMRRHLLQRPQRAPARS
jgi:transposase